MKLNRRRGATLGLVAVAVLVIIVLGVGFFILSQILGGGREVANATDAGVLNVARRALSPTLIQVQLPPTDTDSDPKKDFLGFAVNATGTANSSTGIFDPTHNRISMLALNRIVAQSIIVACNAQDLGTSTASQHAHDVARAAKEISTSLKNLVEGSSGPLPSQFTTVAHSNNTKMFQGNKVELTGLQSTFLRPGLSTNVYVSPDLEAAISVSLPSNLKSNFHHPNALKHDLGGQEQYIAGYIPFSVNAGPNGPIEIAGIPIFPKQKPHLVDVGEFNAGAAPAGVNYLPPNAFRANSRTQDNNSGGFGGAVACALVGALDQDFAAAIPRGYVRIRNGRDASGDHSGIVSSPVVDAGTDVFNNELWAPNGGGVDVSNNGVYALNSNPAGGAANAYMAEWAAFNNSGGTRPTYPPPASGGSSSAQILNALAMITTNAAGFKQPVTEADLEGVTSVVQDCDSVSGWDTAGCHFPGGLPGPGDVVYSIQGLTGAAIGTGTTPGSGGGYTAVEVQKHDLLSKRFGGGRCTSVIPIVGNPPYGMKQFTPGKCYATPGSSVAFGAPGSPLKYIEQIGNAGPGTTGTNNSACQEDMLTRILNRVRQIDPQIQMPAVKAALDSQTLELGEVLYLHVPGPNTVQMVTASPADYFQPDLTADGTSSASVYNCENQYNLAQTVVNAKKNGVGTCSGNGDAGFHEAPYTDGPGNLPGIDRAVWTPASGWRNLLGEIHFQNEAAGAGQFCKPN